MDAWMGAHTKGQRPGTQPVLGSHPQTHSLMHGWMYGRRWLRLEARSQLLHPGVHRAGCLWRPGRGMPTAATARAHLQAALIAFSRAAHRCSDGPPAACAGDSH